MSTSHRSSPGSLSNGELLRRLLDLSKQSRRVEAKLIAHIGEMDKRRLHASQACASTHAYCTQVLNLSEDEAYLRIAVARASRRHPMLLRMLGEGRLHLSGAAKLARHLTLENRENLLERAAHRSRREIEELIVELQPRPDMPERIRRLPEAPRPTTADRGPAPTQLVPERVEGPGNQALFGSDGAESRHSSRVEPLAPERYLVQFTASKELREKLDRLKGLMSKSDLAAVIEAAVTEKIERLEARRFGKAKRPRKSLQEAETSSGVRDIPAPVKRAVYERDEGRCTFRDVQGRRCTERHRLEYHHAGKAYARGGDRSVENIALLCRAHNQHLADMEYGKDVMDRHRRQRRPQKKNHGGFVSERLLPYGIAPPGN